MSDFENNLKNRFSDFEPEIDYKTIEQNWQKIKEQLPKEKDNFKKGFFFFFSIAATLIIIGSVAAFYFFTNKQNSSSDNLISQNTPIETLSNDSSNLNSIDNSGTSHSNNTSESNQNTLETTTSDQEQSTSLNSINSSTPNNNNEEILSKNNQLNSHKNLTKSIESKETTKTAKENNNSSEKTSNNNTNNETTISKNDQLNSHKNLTKSIVSKKSTKTTKENNNSPEDALNNKSIPLTKKSQNQLENSNNSTTDNTSIKHTDKSEPLNDNITKGKENTTTKNETEQVPVSEKDIDLKNRNNNFINSIDNYNLLLVAKENELLSASIISKEDQKPDDLSNKKNTFFIEVLAGTNMTQNTISTTTENLSSKSQQFNFSAGASLNYQLKNKLIVSGQFMFSENKTNYELTKTDVVFLKQTYQADSTQPLHGDIAHYNTTVSQFKLKSNYSYNFSLGGGYTLLQRNKISVDGLILFNVKLSNYSYDFKQQNVQDSSNNFNLTSTNFDQMYTSDKSSNSPYSNITKLMYLGLLPSLSVNYSINNRIDLILKPNYLFNLSKNKVNINDLPFDVKQTNLFINLGVRIKL